MKRASTFALLAAAAILASSDLRAQAGPPPINGNVSFAGGVLTFDTGAIGSAHAITSFSNVVVQSATGACSGMSNAVVTWTPFSFNPPFPPVKPLWTYTTNGVTYSFDATSIDLVFQNSGYLDLRGNGVAHVTGYADTPGTWTLAALLNGPKYTFSATSMSTNTLIPVLTNFAVTNGTVSFSWNSVAGQTYQVQYATDLVPANWQDLGDEIVATDVTTGTNDIPAPDKRRFYRVFLKD